MITIAKIGKIHGYKGEITLHSFTENREDIKNFKNFYLDNGEQVKIKFIKTKGNSFICKIDSMSNAEKAKKMINRFIMITEDELPKLTNGSFYYVQLIRMDVCLHMKKYAKILSINNHGAGDYLEIKTITNEILLVPFIKSHILEVNLEKNIINLNPIYFCNDF
tara:strand:+ start:272 stop:763 length:492 start_codon:yes stop_codon:yes gene_type:complete